MPRTRLANLVELALILVLVAYASIVGYLLSHATAPYDDAFITFRYARNFAEHLGFTYNPGTPSFGTTAPAFALLLGVIQRLTGIDPATSANWISAGALAAAGWFAFKLVAVDFGMWAALVAALSMTFNPMLLSTWGGEWLVAAPVLIAAFYFYRVERLVPAAVAFSLALLLRPEAALAALVPFADAWWHRRPGVWRATLTAAVIGMAWLVISRLVIGEVIPSTFATKLAHARSGVFDTVPHGLVMAGSQFIRADVRTLVIIVLAWQGALAALLRGRVWVAIFGWVAIHLAFYTFLRLPFYHWYLVPVAVGLSLAFAVGISVAIEYLRQLMGARTVVRHAIAWLVVVPLAVAGLVAEGKSSVVWIRVKPDPRERMYNHIGAWLADHTPANASVAYLEIGRIGYFSRRPIVDLMGLVTPGVAQHVGDQDFLWALAAYKPDYYLFSPTFVWAGQPSDEPWFAGAYEPVNEFSAPDFDGKITVYHRRPDAVFRPRPEIEAAQLTNTAVVGEIIADRSQGQSFVATRDRLTGVSVLLATYARHNAGPITFRLEQINPPRVIAERNLDMADVKDNTWRSFAVPPVADSKGRHFRFSIVGEQTQPGNAITFWYNSKDVYRGGEHLINDRPADGDLAFKILYDPQ